MTVHKVTGITPNLAMLGREVMLPATLIAKPPEESMDTVVPFNQSLRDCLRDAHSRVRTATQSVAKTQKAYFDKNVKTIHFTQGQLVWLFWPSPPRRQKCSKLQWLWTGPWRIESFRSDVVVNLRHTQTQQRQAVHVNRLSPCASSNPNSSFDSSPEVPLASSPQISSAQIPAETEHPYRMSKREPTPSEETAGSIGDPRIFRFAITCRVCDLSFHTLQAARRHFADQCLQKLMPRIWCGCCGRTFRNWGRCASHLNVKNAHLGAPIRTVEVSFTSSSEAESRPAPPRSHLPRRTSTATRPAETSAVTATSHPLVTAPNPSIDLPSPPFARVSADFPTLSLSDVDLTVSGLYPALVWPLQQYVPTTPGSVGTSSCAPVSPPVTTALQIGTRTRDPGETWRERFYALADMTEYFVAQIITPTEGDNAFMERAQFLAAWPADTDLAQPLQSLAQQLLPYFRRLAYRTVEPDI